MLNGNKDYFNRLRQNITLIQSALIKTLKNFCFLSHMMHDAYSSAADRIHRNRKNLQRGDTEKSFTKR